MGPPKLLKILYNFCKFSCQCSFSPQFFLFFFYITTSKGIFSGAFLNPLVPKNKTGAQFLYDRVEHHMFIQPFTSYFMGKGPQQATDTNVALAGIRVGWFQPFNFRWSSRVPPFSNRSHSPKALYSP